MRRQIIQSMLLGLLAIIFTTTTYADTLREVVRYALKTNPRLLSAESVRLATEQQLRAAQSGLLPTLDVSTAYGREGSKTPTTIVSNPDDYVNLWRRESSVHLNENLFRGFFDDNNILTNRHRLRSSAYRVQQEVQNVALESVEKYLEVLRISIIERLATRNLEVHQDIYEMIKQRSEKGLSRKADLEQVKGRRASAKARLLAEQGRLKDARTEYVRVVGREPMALTVPPSLAKEALPKSEDKAVATAEKSNPVLKAARAEVDAATARYRLSKAVNYPSVDFEVSAKANYNIDGVRGHDKDYAALVRMNYNLFNGGGDLARQRESAHLLQEAYEIRNRSQRQVVSNVRLAWNALLTSQLRVSDLKEHKDSARETVLAYRQQFQLGQRTLFDLLDAENEWFLSSVAYINDKFNEFFAQYRILHSMGNLTQALGLVMPVEAHVEEDVVTFIAPDAKVPTPKTLNDAKADVLYSADSPAKIKAVQEAREQQAARAQSTHSVLAQLKQKLVKATTPAKQSKPLVKTKSTKTFHRGSSSSKVLASKTNTTASKATTLAKNSALQQQLQHLWRKSHHSVSNKASLALNKHSTVIQSSGHTSRKTSSSQSTAAMKALPGYHNTANKWGIGRHTPRAGSTSMKSAGVGSNQGLTTPIKATLTQMGQTLSSVGHVTMAKVQQIRAHGKRFWQRSSSDPHATNKIQSTNAGTAHTVFNMNAHTVQEKTLAAVKRTSNQGKMMLAKMADQTKNKFSNVAKETKQAIIQSKQAMSHGIQSAEQETQKVGSQFKQTMSYSMASIASGFKTFFKPRESQPSSTNNKQATSSRQHAALA